MSKPLISVVMPVWKPNPRYLRKSVESILVQTYDNIEVLIVFDKSSQEIDNPALTVLEDYRDDHRLRLHIKRHKGSLSDALNFGITSSNGDYIARMDGDDISFPTRLEESLNYLEVEKAHLVGTWAYVVDEKDQVIGKLTPPAKNEEIRRLMMLHNCLLHSSIMFKKGFIKEIGVYNPAFHGAEDYELYMRAIGRGYRLLNVPNFLIYLRENLQSITRSRRWIYSRKNSIRVKFMGLTKYRFSGWQGLFYCVASLATLIVSPRFSLRVKSLIGWYKPIFPQEAIRNTGYCLK